jgi:hypothetical protein
MKSIIYLFIYMLENETGIGILLTLWRLALAFFVLIVFTFINCYQKSGELYPSLSLRHFDN